MNPLTSDVSAHADAFEAAAAAIRKAQSEHGREYAVLVAEYLIRSASHILLGAQGPATVIEQLYRIADELPTEN